MALVINKTSYQLPEAYLNPTPKAKRTIVWHFDAASSVNATFGTFMGYGTRKISTAFSLGRDGVVYQFWDPTKYWAFHTGSGVDLDSVSVGVEIENVGILRPVNGNMCWWPGNFTRTYCKVGDQGLYATAAKPWRGERYWATYTQAQIDALPLLSDYLHNLLQIPKVRPKELAPEVLTRDAINYYKRQPVIAHHHVAIKFDLGPLFNWDLVC